MKVIAIESIEDGHVRWFGLGEYIGDIVPDVEPFKTFGLKNPCIKLDSGKYVWGFQCWWGPEENVQPSIDSAKSIILCDPDDIRPFEK